MDIQNQPQEMPLDPNQMAMDQPIPGQEMEPMQSPVSDYNSTPIQDGNPYFMGDYALIKFSGGEEGYGPNTYWLVDKGNKTIRPFESNMALDAAFGEELQSALENAITIAPPSIDSEGNITSGVLSDFTILGPEYAIKEDGTSKPLDFSPSQLKGRYGKPVNESVEGIATEVVDGFLRLLKTNEDKTQIPGSFIDKLKNDNRLMAYYISAMAYGGYTLDDLYSDISRQYNNSKET